MPRRRTTEPPKPAQPAWKPTSEAREEAQRLRGWFDFFFINPALRPRAYRKMIQEHGLRPLQDVRMPGDPFYILDELDRKPFERDWQREYETTHSLWQISRAEATAIGKAAVSFWEHQPAAQVCDTCKTAMELVQISASIQAGDDATPPALPAVPRLKWQCPDVAYHGAVTYLCPSCLSPEVRHVENRNGRSGSRGEWTAWDEDWQCLKCGKHFAITSGWSD